MQISLSHLNPMNPHRSSNTLVVPLPSRLKPLSVQFGSQPTLSLEDQRRADTNAQALSLFSQFKGDNESLIKALQGLGVVVIRGNDDPRVDTILKENAALAMTYAPRPLTESLFNPNNYSALPPIEREFYRELDMQGKIALVLPSQSDPESLLHEAYHCVQAKNNLRLNTGDLYAPAARQFYRTLWSDLHRAVIRSAMQPSALIKYMPKPGQPLTSSGGNNFKAALIDSIRDNDACQQLMIDRLEQLRSVPEGLKKAIRTEARTEYDVRDFLAKHANAIGLIQDPVSAATLRTERWIFGELYELFKSVAN